MDVKFLHIEVSLKVIVDLPLLKKYLLQIIIPCVTLENYVTCCEVLNLTYFPSLSSKKYCLFFVLIKVKGVVNLYVEVNWS